jgi:hypothetical protein
VTEGVSFNNALFLCLFNYLAIGTGTWGREHFLRAVKSQNSSKNLKKFIARVVLSKKGV